MKHKLGLGGDGEACFCSIGRGSEELQDFRGLWYLSLQGLAAALGLLQLGLQLAVVLLVLELQGHQLLLQLLLRPLQRFEAAAQLGVLST